MEFWRFLVVIVALACVVGCTKVDTREISDETPASADSTGFPKVIDGGKRVVYQFAKMTPRGFRYFTDTVDYRGDLTLPFLHGNVVFPLAVTESERESAKGVLAISLPGYFDETIIGIINDTGHLRLKIENADVILSSSDAIDYSADNFNAAFRRDSVSVDVAATMITTPTRTHRAGRGALRIYKADSLLQACEIFLVLKL